LAPFVCDCAGPLSASPASRARRDEREREQERRRVSTVEEVNSATIHLPASSVDYPDGTMLSAAPADAAAPAEAALVDAYVLPQEDVERESPLEAMPAAPVMDKDDVDRDLQRRSWPTAPSADKAVRFAEPEAKGTDLEDIAVRVSSDDSQFDATGSAAGEGKSVVSETTTLTPMSMRSKVSRFQSWRPGFIGAQRAPLGERILPKNSQNFGRTYGIRSFFEDWLETNPPSKAFGLIVGIILYFVCITLELDEAYPKANDMLALTVLVSIFWIFEVLPLPATALIPVVLMPFSGISSSTVASTSYWGWVQMLFLGAFLVDIAVEHVDLHKRIALKVLLKVGVKRPWVVVLAFMMISYFLSMWCSNTATAVMLVPFATGLIESAASTCEGEAARASSRKFAVSVLLAIAYGSSCGGMATLIGTPPNGVLAGLDVVKGQIGAIEWFRFAFPVSVLVVAIAFLTICFCSLRGVSLELDEAVVRSAHRDLGPFNRDEMFVAIIQLLQFAGFLIRADVINEPDITGSADLKGVNDATIACAAAALLFVVPSEKRLGEVLLPWEVAEERVPWGVLLLMGGGFAIAQGFQDSKLTKFIGEKLASGAASLSRFTLTYMIVAAVCLLTEVTSNTATANIILPILMAVAQENLLHPLAMALPATLACSFAFMLPAATPPNSVVFATGLVRISDMVKAGVIINILAVVATSALVYYMAGEVFDVAGPFPRWACLKKACLWVDRAGEVSGMAVESQACALMGHGLCKFRDGYIMNVTGLA